MLTQIHLSSSRLLSETHSTAPSLAASRPTSMTHQITTFITLDQSTSPEQAAASTTVTGKKMSQIDVACVECLTHCPSVGTPSNISHPSNVLPLLSISPLIFSVLPSSISFFPPPCPNYPNIGPNCTTVGTTCDQLQPCANDGTCINANLTVQGYVCVCISGFSGTYCELDYRPCKSNTCWNNGMINGQQSRGESSVFPIV